MLIRHVMSILVIFLIGNVTILLMSTPVIAPITINPNFKDNLIEIEPICSDPCPTVTITSDPSPDEEGIIQAIKGGRTITFTAIPTGFPDGNVNIHCGEDGDDYKYGEDKPGTNGDKYPFKYKFKNLNEDSIKVQCIGKGVDALEKYGHFNFKYDDTEAPEFENSEQPIEREATGKETKVDFLTDVESFVKDTVDSDPDIQCEPKSGSMFPLGENTVTCNARDYRDNEADHEFKIYVSDKTAPKLHVPADINAIATTSSGATVHYNVSANDLVDGQLQPVCSPASGSEFPFGPTPVTCSASDSSEFPKANTVSDSFYVSVGDSSAPTIDLVSGPKIKPGQSGLIVIYSVKATDKIDGTIDVECNPPSGHEFPPGEHTITCIASDSHGNNATKIITISY